MNDERGEMKEERGKMKRGFLRKVMSCAAELDLDFLCVRQDQEPNIER